MIPLTAAALAAACEVEPTPREYFDHQTPAAVERQASAEELQDRILAMAQALNRGNASAAMIALAPAPDAYVLTPGDTIALQGADQIGNAFVGAGGPVTMRDVEVQVGPRQNVAWFRARMGVGGGAEGEGEMRLTGVYLRNEGAWQLVQAHLSRATDSESPPPANPAPAADSAGAG